MVFEAIVVELLNKFLKQYVENLDSSQLKLGIWGGDVVLNNLKIRTTIFDDLDLPVRVKWGKLGRLVMKIPWKNLYGSQVVVNVEELLMVIIPNNEIKYDQMKEEKWANDRKQAKLRAVEEAKKREIEDQNKPNDSFIEKLLTQIIKNIQVVIKNIHIRYENKTTIPEAPFSVGITMSNLSAQTTVKDPTNTFANLVKKDDNFIYKVVGLEGLAVYWNSSSTLFSEIDAKDLTKILLDTIPTDNFKPEGFNYMFGPFSASAFLRLNPKPELDGSKFTIPKMFVNVHLREIDLALTHNQFSDAMLFLQDYQRLCAAAKYKKYRPVNIPVFGFAKIWWHFAYNAIAEDIRRRKKEWSWQNMKEHRQMCQKYSELFKIKLTSKKLPPETVAELNKLEKNLSVFNLILLREQVHVELERTQIKNEPQGSSSWFSGWFGYGTELKTDKTDDELAKKIESVMTVQEKQKLYKAIGYEESAPPTKYPPTFVEVQLWFHLDEIKITVFDDHLKKLVPILSTSVKTVKMEFEQRPSAFAMKMVLIIGKFQVLGKLNKDNTFPELVTSNCGKHESLFEILYETKPLSGRCDQCVHVKARPLRIIYHADTINKVRDVFDTGSSEDVTKIVAATSASLPTFQRITSLGLQYAIEKRAILEVKVNIMSSYLIIPYEGVYQPKKEMLVLMLGELSIETEENDQKDVSVKDLFRKGTSEKDIFSAVVSASYTKFKCQLAGLQVLFQLPGEDWVHASSIQGTSPLRFLESTNLVVTIKKSLVSDDARIPKIIIEGNLPSLAFNFSEERFVSLAALICSIPTKSEDAEPIKKNTSASAWSLQSLGIQLESKLVHIHKDLPPAASIEYVQGIDLVGHFEMNEFVVNVSKNEDSIKKSKSHRTEEKFLNLRLVKMEIDVTSKTFETVNLLKLGGIEFKQYHMKNALPFVTTKGLQQDYYLFVAEYINLDPKMPDFHTRKGSITNRLTLNITPLNVLLNREALLTQIAFVTTVQRRLDLVKQNSKYGRVADAGKLKDIAEETMDIRSDVQTMDKKVISRGKSFRKKREQKEVIDFFLEATLDEIDVMVENQGQGVAEFRLRGSSVEISTRKSYTNVDFKLKEILLQDLNPLTLHKKIVSSMEEQTLNSRVTVYNSDYFGAEKSVDMSVEAEVGGIRCFYVNIFFSRAFDFLNAFQSQVESLKEGATVAAQRAKENVMKAYQNATQICLSAKITAPLLIIPKKSTSLETLVVDLGVLTIKNSISELDYSSDGEIVSRPIIDTMRLHLQNLKFTRCLLSNDLKTYVNEKVFLIPVSFELTIKRNLSKGWFRVIPELEILARLAAIHVTLTHEDLSCIVNIVQENTSEGGQIGSADKISKSESKADKQHKEQIIQHPFLLHEIEDGLPGEHSSLFTAIKFMFFMDSFVFDAIDDSNKQDENKKVSGNVGLARLILETISLKGRMFSDGSVHTSVTLSSCLLDDTRPGKEGRLTRLMEKTNDPNATEKETESSAANTMIEVIYQKKDLDSFVDVRVYRFTLILSMDFLQKLGEFFSLQNVSTPGVEALETGKIGKTVEKHVQPARDFMPLEGEGESYRPPTFTINLRLEKPDIVIVANMDSVDTDALIFHTEMVMKYRIADTRQIISGTLNDIELYSCCFNPTKRSSTLAQVIKPFTISVAGSTPQDQGLHVDVCLTEIVITINPSIVELITKCYEALLTDTTANQQDAKEKVYTNLWDIETFELDDYWFLKPDQGIEALGELHSFCPPTSPDKVICEEICLLAIPSIIVSLEGRAAQLKNSLILLEMGFQSQCYNWSSNMVITNTLTVEMQYYNKTVSAWEPLIEPVEAITDKDKKHTYTPWEMNCTVTFGDESNLESFLPPKMSVNLSCTEILQLTMTKTCLDVLKNVVDTYTSVVTKGIVKKLPGLPPYTIKNETGLTVELLLEESHLQVCSGIKNNYKNVKLESHSEVELENNPTAFFGLKKTFSMSVIKKETRLQVMFPLANNPVLELPLGVSSKRYFPIHMPELKGEKVWGLISEVSVTDNSTTVVLRSHLNVVNYFIEPVNIHILSENGSEAVYVGTVEGNSEFSLPFDAVYGSSKELFFSVSGYSLSTHPFVWEDIKKELSVSTLLQCDSKVPENNDPFFIQVVGEAEQIYFSNTNRKTMSSFLYKIHLQPTLKIFNSLPVNLVICFQGNSKERFVHPGNSLQITNAEPGVSTITLRINDYLEKEWSCKETILFNPPEFLVWRFVSYNGLSPETINLGIHCTYKQKTAVYTIYCPFFMVNKTHHLLSYKFEGSSSVFYHPKNLKLPVMFSPISKKFFGKKNAYLKVEHSEWSEKFPVDVAGSGGTVECECPNSNIIYKVSVSIRLSYNSLTRIVVFTPYYVFVNTTKFAIGCQETDSLELPWLEVPADNCRPFWPRSQAKNKTIQIRPKGSGAVSPPFAYDSTDSCLLRLSHKYGGIFVNIQATQAGTYITFSAYEPGQAPALILNHSDKVINLIEEGTKWGVALKPFQKLMHSWVCPTGRRNLIVMSPKHIVDSLVLDQDAEGIIFSVKGDPVRYVSFLDGTQRTILFTDERGLSSSISSSLRETTSGIEVLCKIQGLGISLVNDITQTEILYMGFVSSGIVWEAKKYGKNRFKALHSEDVYKIESAYTKYQQNSTMKSIANPVFEIGGKFYINFEKMEMTEPHLRQLRRTFEPGLWAAYRVMDNQVMLHVKINKMQIDNQLHDCIFPVILSPVAPPKTVATMHQGSKPFVELSIVKKASDRSGVEQYKYFQILVQEFHVKIDITFLQAIWEYLAAEDYNDEQEKIYFNKDLEFMQKPLSNHVEVVSSTEHKNFYDLLHFSPLKIHFSFSLAGNITSGSLPPSFGVMLQSLGVTLTDVHDVIFRLSYFERKSIFLTNSQLVNEVISHYYGQTIRQAYVLLLGLDVIGNPYGLIVGIGEGVEAFFYEPFQGIIQGPSDFATGVAIGCKSLLGHTVSSTAGTLGKLTETLGKGLAVLSLDREYQLQRMENQNRQENIQASMARGGRGLVMGVFEGVTGVVKKPLQGAKQEGVGGFFKGMGKGMMGLVTRPVTGVVDFASTSLNAVKRVADSSVENRRLRPPRFFRDDSLVQPYNLFDAQGSSIFYSISKRKYCTTDKYEYHAELRGKEVMLLTNKRIILAEQSEMFGTWQEHLAVSWKSMPESPRCHTKGVALTMPQKSGLPMKDKPDVKILLIDDPNIREVACKKMVELYQLENAGHDIKLRESN